MSKKEKLIDAIKTGFIALLLVFTAFLLVRTEYYNYAYEYIAGIFTSARDSIQPDTSTESAAQPSAKIEPMAVSVFLGTGSRYASVYDKESVQTDYQRFSVYLAEALGSSSEPVKVNRLSWIESLGRESVYFRFFSPQPLSLLSDILGAKMSSSAGQAMSEVLCLSCENESVRLYYSAGGDYYYCETGVSAEALRARLMEYIPNGAYFSHEISSVSDMRDTMLVPQTMPAVQSVIAGSSVSQQKAKELLFVCFDINEYTVSEYTESDGKTVYLDSRGSLHITPSGIAEYFYDGNSGIYAGGDHIDQLLDLCWNVVGNSLGQESGAADIYFAHVQQDGSKARLCFSYSINGIPISLSDGSYAAEFEFSGSRLIYAKLNFRIFSQGEGTLEVPPLLLSAAIALSNGSDSIKLTYSESGTGINCVWVPQ